MARSFFYGLLAGGGFAALGLGTLSIVSDPPKSPEITVASPTPTAAPERKTDETVSTTLPAVEEAKPPKTEASVAAAPALDTEFEAPSDPKTAAVPYAQGVKPPAVTPPTPPTRQHGQLPAPNVVPVRFSWHGP